MARQSEAQPARGHAPAPAGARAARRGTILELVQTTAIGSQEELAALLRARGFGVTQATVSRDIAELGLVKAPRGDRHVYVTPGSFAPGGGTAGPALPRDGLGRDVVPGAGSHPAGGARLRRILAEYPLTVARSGLILVLVGDTGSAMAIAQAIDESDLTDQVGTLAGDNTVLVLFADEPALERWRARFEAVRHAAGAIAAGEAAPVSTYP